MIDAERMLGSLVRNAMSGGRGRSRSRHRSRRGRGGLGKSLLGGAGKGALAMGALGVAMAAFEHFTNQQKPGSALDGGKPATPPPPPPPVPSSIPSSGQPSTPGSSVVPPPPPPPPPGAARSPEAAPPAETSSSESLLLVRAMIAAANADHEVDDNERAQILRGLDAANCSAEERQYLLAEIESPIEIDILAAEAASPDMARQVYLASLMAIDVDTPAEEAYLARLAAKLKLTAADVDEIEGML